VDTLTVCPAPVQAEFREQYREVMDLVHHCMASKSRVQRPVLEVVLKIALEAEYRRDAPVPQVCLDPSRLLFAFVLTAAR
jgi:hypothetical protein